MPTKASSYAKATADRPRAQKSKHSTHQKSQAIKTKLKEDKEARGDYGDMRGYSRDYILQVGEELKAWALEGMDKVKLRRLSLRRFFHDKPYCQQTAVDDWCKKYPEFKKNYQEAKLMIGTMRESGMLLRELDPASTMKLLHHWLPEYKKLRDEDDERRIKIEKAKQKSAIEEQKASSHHYHPLGSKKDGETHLP